MENTRGQGPNTDRSSEQSKSSESIRRNAGHENDSADKNNVSTMNEKSSTMGRRDRSSGISTKDGLTGSDYDGQVTDR